MCHGHGFPTGRRGLVGTAAAVRAATPRSFGPVPSERHHAVLRESVQREAVLLLELRQQPHHVRARTGESHWVLRGDRGVTYAATPPDGTEILAGD